MAFWHGRVLTATYYFRRRGIVVMISENFDGEWIARIIEHFGFRTSRGSSSRGGQRALLQLKREMDQGRPSGFAVDGPRGPARKAQPGAVWLAKLTGNPVVPFHMEASSYWSLKSWDRTQIPTPFSTVALLWASRSTCRRMRMRRRSKPSASSSSSPCSPWSSERRRSWPIPNPQSLIPNP